jgi:hypothetical protein
MSYFFLTFLVELEEEVDLRLEDCFTLELDDPLLLLEIEDLPEEEERLEEYDLLGVLDRLVLE